jgi:hypothetical protein
MVASFMTPLNPNFEVTYEDPCIIARDARDKAYDEWDFVRLYGRDFEARLIEAGFDVETLRPAENIGEEQRRIVGVWNDRIFVCKRVERGLESRKQRA